MSKAVLIVDDHKETCGAIRLVLEFEGYHCVDFPDGKSALEALDREIFHVVLLDLNLGEASSLNGMDVLEKLLVQEDGIP